jgi:type 1 fimbria pilin
MASGSTDTTFGITVQFPGTTLDTGTYVTSDAGTNFSLALAPSGNIIYAANATSVPPVLNITISSYISSTKTVTGTFSGQAYDFNGNILAITNGKFKAQLQ